MTVERTCEIGGSKMKKLAKGLLAGFLEKLSEEYVIVAPVRNDKGQVEFKCTSDFDGISLEKNTINAAKEFFFPQNEKLFTYKDGDIIESISDRKVIIFGARPCDMRSIEVLDKVFLDERFIDTYYINRRKNAVMIGYACPVSEPGCFCMSLEIDPADSASAQIFMFEDKDNYYFRIGSPPSVTTAGISGSEGENSGSAISGSEGDNTGSAISGLLKLMDSLEDVDIDSSIMKAVHNQKKYFDLEFPLDEKKLFDAPFWEEAFRKCIGCGTCTYLCPTCHCFEMYNRKDTEGIQRIRCWDSCQFSLFTEHASGHNPRNTQKERIRQRIMHKFSYYPRNYGVVSCVGCGRCIRKCPVTLDIREILRTVEKYTAERSGADGE